MVITFGKRLGLRSFLLFFILLNVTNLYAQKYNFDSIAEDLFASSLKKSSIAVTTDAKSSGVSENSKKAIEDAISSALQRKAVSLGHSVMSAAELGKINDYKVFTGQTSDFEELTKNAKADLIVVISIQKTSNKSAQVTGKLLGVSGAEQGRVLAASKSYQIEIDAIYRLFIEGVLDSAGNKSVKYTDLLLAAITDNPKIIIANDKQVADFSLKAELDFKIQEVKSKDSVGLGIMGAFMGSMPGMPSGLGGGFANTIKTASNAKEVSATSKIIGVSSDGSRLISEKSESKEQPSQFSDSQLNDVRNNYLALTLKSAAIEIGSKITSDGKNSTSDNKTKSSLLD